MTYHKKLSPYSSHQLLIRMMRSTPGLELSRSRILDVGCADGWLLSELSGEVRSAIGVEPDSAARRRAERLGVEVLSSLDALGETATPPFDVLILADVIEHVPNVSEFLKQCLAHLRVGGFVILSVPNIAHWPARMAVLAGRFPRMDRGPFDRTHLQFFTRRTLIPIIAGCGVEVLKESSTPSPLSDVLPFKRSVCRAILRSIEGLEFRLARLMPTLFSYQLLYVGQYRPAAVNSGA